MIETLFANNKNEFSESVVHVGRVHHCMSAEYCRMSSMAAVTDSGWTTTGWHSISRGWTYSRIFCRSTRWDRLCMSLRDTNADPCTLLSITTMNHRISKPSKWGQDPIASQRDEVNIPRSMTL